MKNEKLAMTIAKERKLLQSYEAKEAEYAEKIRKSKAKLQQLEMMEDSQKYNAMAAAVKASGVSMEDILAALQSGDLLALQERMEAAQVEAADETEDENAEDDVDENE